MYPITFKLNWRGGLEDKNQFQCFRFSLVCSGTSSSRFSVCLFSFLLFFCFVCLYIYLYFSSTPNIHWRELGTRCIQLTRLRLSHTSAKAIATVWMMFSKLPLNPFVHGREQAPNELHRRSGGSEAEMQKFRLGGRNEFQSF